MKSVILKVTFHFETALDGDNFGHPNKQLTGATIRFTDGLRLNGWFHAPSFELVRANSILQRGNARPLTMRRTLNSKFGRRLVKDFYVYAKECYASDLAEYERKTRAAELARLAKIEAENYAHHVAAVNVLTSSGVAHDVADLSVRALIAAGFMSRSEKFK
jgi:hypothetical protein